MARKVVNPDADVDVYDTNTNVVHTAVTDPANRRDLVRWGPIIAGLFTALATFILLNLLGAVIGAYTYDVGNSLSAFGIGAGIWGALVTLLSFLLGGWIAARSAGVFGRGNGILNGAMVWVVTIPLLLLLLNSIVTTAVGGIFNVAGTAASAAGSVASTAASTVGSAAGGALDLAVTDQDVENVQATAAAAGEEISAEDARVTAQAVIDELPVDQAQATAGALATSAAEALPSQEQVEQTVNQGTDTAGTALLSTFLALLLGLGAAVLGGLLGARKLVDEVVR